jgi:hypothetical protein
MNDSLELDDRSDLTPDPEPPSLLAALQSLDPESLAALPSARVFYLDLVIGQRGTQSFSISPANDSQPFFPADDSPSSTSATFDDPDR